MSRMPPEVHRTPGAYAVGSTSDWDQGRALGAALAAECADFGFHLDFAPVLDVWSNPDNTVIGKRAFGSDWKVVSGFGAAVSNALQAAGVIPVVKHFPGHGDTVVDSHMGLPVVDKSLEDLSSRSSLPSGPHLGRRDPSGRAEAVPAVMVAHILMTQLDPDLPASLSPAVVTDLCGGSWASAAWSLPMTSPWAPLHKITAWARQPCWPWRPGATSAGLPRPGQRGRRPLGPAGGGGIRPHLPGAAGRGVRRILSLKLEYGVSGEPLRPT